MNWLSSLFITDLSGVTLVAGHYDAFLVVLSVLVASSASFFALRLAETARFISVKRYQMVAQFSGALILAGGIWSMHFVGMLAFVMPHSMHYDPSITILSLFPALIASYMVIKSLVRNIDSITNTLRNGIIVGAGIGAMHYIGMAAMEMHLTLKYNPYLFITSIFVAVFLACVALGTRSFMRKTFPKLSPIKIKLVAAPIMGCAIAGMHYTGMAAAYFIDDTANGMTFTSAFNDDGMMGYAVGFFSMIVFVLAVNVSAQLRYRQMLAEKTDSEARLQAILDTATDGLMTINAKGEIQELNAASERIFGWSQEELIGQCIHVLMPDADHPDYDSFMVDYFNPSKISVLGNSKEISAKHKEGTVFPIQVGIGSINLREGELLYVAYVSDISERKAMESRVTKSEERLSSLVRNIPGVSFRCLLDDNWTPLFLSDAIFDLNGHHAKEYLDGTLSFGSWLLPEDQTRVVQFFEQAVGVQDRYELEYRITHRDGRILWVLESGTIVYDEVGNAKWIDGVMLDISERKAMESELRHAKQKAEEAADSKAAFLANMSHEIRTPMNSIIGFSDILLDSELPTDARSHLQTISRSAQSLLHLLNDILDSAKLDKSKLEIEKLPFRLSACVDMVVSTLWLQAKNKDLTLGLEVQDDLPPVLLGAEDRIRQVLMNLVGNAIKFTEKGSVDLRISNTPNKQGWLRFAVVDTGIGIAQDRIDAIFEPFTQADASMSRRFGGTGLGTTISKQLVELMGGDINATSVIGQGSCFYFDLPLQEANESDLAGDKYILNLPPMNVLVADDIEENITLLTLLLSKRGHTVWQARNGQEAVEMFQTNPPDIVLMDIQMPVLDGLEASRTIREYEQDHSLEQTPIIALTASVLLEDRLQAKAAGMTGFANKPVNIAQLTQEMARALELDAEALMATARQEVSQVLTPYHVVHLAKGTELWGDEAMYVSEVIKFHDKYDQTVQSLSKLAKAEQWKRLAEHAHALKGVSGNLALLPLLPLYAQLENVLREQSFDKVTQAVERIQMQWKVFDQEVQVLAPTEDTKPDTSIDEPELSRYELHEMLEQWLQITLSGEIDDELANNLEKGVGARLRPTIRKAINAVDEFDFDVAITRIKEAQTSI